MAKKPRHPEHDLLVRDNSEPRIIEMDKPSLDWLPLRLAPQHFQSISGPFRNQALTSDAIEEFVRTSVAGPSIIKCALYFSEFFAIQYSSQADEETATEVVHVAPYAPHEWIDPDNGTIRPALEAIADRVGAVWTQMEERFRSAHRLGDCRVMVRDGSPLSQHFTAITPEAFAAFKIIDWKNGIAESMTGDRLYSIFAAPPPKQDQKALSFVREFERSPLKLQVGQYLYLHHRNGLVGDKVTAKIMKDIRVHCFGKEVNRLDEKTIRAAYKLFRNLVSAQPSAEMLQRLAFRSAMPQKK
jgi:hypothetical protein